MTDSKNVWIIETPFVRITDPKEYKLNWKYKDPGFPIK